MNDENLTRRGRGRPPGSPNKIGKAAKDVVAEAAAGLGGAERLLTWAQSAPENEKAFWTTIYPKLLPLQVSGEGGGPVQVSDVSASSIDDRIAELTARLANGG